MPDSSNAKHFMPRNRIWKFVGANFPCLEVLAREIAFGNVLPPPLPAFPPLNFLANGKPPATAPLGLGGFLTGPPTVCAILKPALAALKGGNPAGFCAAIPMGLSIMFGTWTDYCLGCWAKYPRPDGKGDRPILILSPDHGQLCDLSAPVLPGVDWGVAELGRKFYASKDPSTKNLFGSIYTASSKPGIHPNCAWPLTAAQRFDLEEFIARKRILVFNVWPWFRSGAHATGSKNIHGSLAFPPIVKWVNDVVNCLVPDRIGTLGTWAYNSDAGSLTDDIGAKARTGTAAQSWFIRNFLPRTRFKGDTADQPQIRQFYHPALRRYWTRRPPWFSTTPGYGPGLNNQQAFEEFLR